jgi:hypothetical protein
MNHLDRWTVNESLLQSYRSIFISSQSFLLTAGAVFSGKQPEYLTYATTTLGLLMIWFIWFPVVRARLKIVDYHKYASGLRPRALREICSEQEYVLNAVKRKDANQRLGITNNWRATRIKMDVMLPLLFTVLWIILATGEILQH